MNTGGAMRFTSKMSITLSGFGSKRGW